MIATLFLSGFMRVAFAIPEENQLNSIDSKCWLCTCDLRSIFSILSSMPKRPNIVIFNPDQWRGDVMGHLGNPAAVTPHLDAFVQEDAVSFRNAFCQNPVCTPSRCSFLTGRYPHTMGHRTMHHMLHSEKGESHLFAELKRAGYQVWWGGKNDFIPGDRPVQDFCDLRFQATEHDFKRWKLTPRMNLHHDTSWRGAADSDNFYSFQAGCVANDPSQIYGDGDWQTVLGAIDFIHQYEGEQPYCMFLALNHPHPPYGVEEPYFSAIDRNQLPPRIPTPALDSGKPMIMAGIRQNQKLETWTEDRWDELRATYYGMCARVDHQFGLLIDALKQAGAYEQTAVFFLSDHGDYTGDYGLVEKAQNLFDDCLTRVPLIVKTPAGVASVPNISDALVELIDFSATVYDVAQIAPSYDHFGRSLLPLITGERDTHRDAVFSEGGRRLCEVQAMESNALSDFPEENLYYPRLVLQGSNDPPYHGKGAMCRTHRFKYVHRLYESDEFYDLEADPMELMNRIDDPQLQGAILRLQRRLTDWYMETCDVLPRGLDAR
jgi:arylsulfatase A-like enzyme